MTNLPIKPNLKDYLNVHHYLEDLYKYRKVTEPQFSYELWAAELNIDNRNYLRQLVLGRRQIKEGIARQFCERLNLQNDDKEYFLILTFYSNAKSQSERNIYGNKLTQVIRSSDAGGEIKDYQNFVSSTLYPKIQTLLSFKDIPKETKYIADILNISLAQSEQALDLLQNIGLAQKNCDATWSALSRSFTIQDNIGSQSLLHYHEKSLQEAILAQTFPKNERRYHSILLPLNPSDFQSFNEDIRKFAIEMRSKYDSDNLQGKKLFQANFNFYAVSKETDLIVADTNQ